MHDNTQVTIELDRRNPNLCRFTSTQTLYVGTKNVHGKDDAKGLPLAERLMCLSGVEKFQLIGHLLVVTKKANGIWEHLNKEIASILRSYLISSQALTADDVEERMMLMGRSTKEKVQYLIDRQINPGVAEHGGSVGVVAVKDNILYLRLYGGCQGCGAADFTLKQGIETIVKRAVPEIAQIIDLTNHRAGVNPYYQRADLDRPASN